MNEQQYDHMLNIETTGYQYGFPKLAKYHRYEPTPYSGLEQLFESYELPLKHIFWISAAEKGVFLFIYIIASIFPLLALKWIRSFLQKRNIMQSNI